MKKNSLRLFVVATIATLIIATAAIEFQNGSLQVFTAAQNATSPPPTSPITPNATTTPNESSIPTNITIYGGPVTTNMIVPNATAETNATLGFGFSADNITSPGPTLMLQEGNMYNITFCNVDTSNHTFAITMVKSINGAVLFNATIPPTNQTAMPTNVTYVPPGGNGSVTFNVTDSIGSFFYVSTVPNDVENGMWGICNITAANATKTTSSPSPIP